jgi:hypothetical protein
MGHAYRVGARFRTAAGDGSGGTVQIAVDGQLVRIHPTRHDRTKERAASSDPPPFVT